MKELHMQLKDWKLNPFSQEDLEILKHFLPNQVVKVKLFGTTKERSLKQNKRVHAMFRDVSKNTDDLQWNTPEKVKRQVKIKMQFVDMDRTAVSNGIVYVSYRSFAFDKMEQPEANRVYNDAKLICADFLGVDPEVLDARAKEASMTKDELREKEHKDRAKEKP